ncbi:hypothetical protein GJAV_G00051480 [Gymnothorax javanicus]|nr:hypothetical protein GJAV_G00051480 [Gymnothorax javanicus]
MNGLPVNSRTYIWLWSTVEMRRNWPVATPSEEHPYPEKWLGYDAPLNNTPGLLKTLRSRGRTLKGQSAYERAGGGERLGVDARAGSREDVTSAEDGEAAHPCPDHDYASPHPPAQVVSPIKEESSQWHEGSSLIDGKVDVKPVIIKTEENEQEIAEQQPVVQVPKLEPCVKKEEEEKHKVCAFPEAAPHRCADCGEAFSGSASLQLHQSVHVGGTQDGKSFNKLSQPSLLQGAFMGSKKRTLSCDQSREAFAASLSLKAVSWLQASKKTEICGVCGRIFNDTRAFQEHMGSHLGEQLHRCPECQKAFASVWDMMAHWRVHRGREAQQGGDSSESFRQRDQQGEHAAELPCSCGRHVQQYSQLEPLQSFRKGEKPYHCEKCDKTFVRKSSLNRHQKVHQGLPRCAQCHLSFRNPSQLARHQQIHTAGHDALSCSLCKTGDQHHHYVRVPPRCREATLIPRVSGSLTGPS